MREGKKREGRCSLIKKELTLALMVLVPKLPSACAPSGIVVNSKKLSTTTFEGILVISKAFLTPLHPIYTEVACNENMFVAPQIDGSGI